MSRKRYSQLDEILSWLKEVDSMTIDRTIDESDLNCLVNSFYNFLLFPLFSFFPFNNNSQKINTIDSPSLYLHLHRLLSRCWRLEGGGRGRFHGGRSGDCWFLGSLPTIIVQVVTRIRRNIPLRHVISKFVHQDFSISPETETEISYTLVNTHFDVKFKKWSILIYWEYELVISIKWRKGITVVESVVRCIRMRWFFFLGKGCFQST